MCRTASVGTAVGVQSTLSTGILALPPESADSFGFLAPMLSEKVFDDDDDDDDDEEEGGEPKATAEEPTPAEVS